MLSIAVISNSQISDQYIAAILRIAIFVKHLTNTFLRESYAIYCDAYIRILSLFQLSSIYSTRQRYAVNIIGIDPQNLQFKIYFLSQNEFLLPLENGKTDSPLVSSDSPLVASLPRNRIRLDEA